MFGGRPVKARVIVFALVVAATLIGGTAPARAGGYLDSRIDSLNAQLSAKGIDAHVGAVEMFTLGYGVPDGRTLRFFARWAPYDPRRAADGASLSYLVRQGLGATSSGLSNNATEPAIDVTLATWDRDACISNAPIVKRADRGTDPDVFDELIGQGDSAAADFSLFTNRPADIIEAGFRPRAFFDWFAPNGGAQILAMTIQFFHAYGDINHDGYKDMAFTETYYNDSFAWSIAGGLHTIDVQTVALHENGHALGLSHFGPPPLAVMNPTYTGIVLTPLASDHAAACVLWGGWPNR